MSNQRELKFIFKVQDDGIGVIREAGTQLQTLAKSGDEANRSLEAVSSSAETTLEKFTMLTSAVTGLNQVTRGKSIFASPENYGRPGVSSNTNHPNYYQGEESSIEFQRDLNALDLTLKTTVANAETIFSSLSVMWQEAENLAENSFAKMNGNLEAGWEALLENLLAKWQQFMANVTAANSEGQALDFTSALSDFQLFSNGGSIPGSQQNGAALFDSQDINLYQRQAREANALLQDLIASQHESGSGFTSSLSSFRSFTRGMKQGLEESTADWRDWTDASRRLTDNMVRDVSYALSDTLFAAMKRDFDSIDDIWQDLTDSMLKAFLDMLVQMAVAWAAQKLMTSFSGSSMGMGGQTQGGAGAGGGGGLFNMIAGSYGMPGMGSMNGMGALQTQGGTMGTISAASPYIAAALAVWQLLKATGAGEALVDGAGDFFDDIPLVGKPIKNVIKIVGRLLGFEDGTEYVSETGIYNIHKGERIFSADHNERLIKAIEALPRESSRTINGPLLVVEGPLVADEAVMNGFVEEIDQRLKRLAERRF